MKNLFGIGLVMVLIGVALVAMSTTTTTGLQISVGSLCVALKLVMERVEVLERGKAVEMEA